MQRYGKIKILAIFVVSMLILSGCRIDEAFLQEMAADAVRWIQDRTTGDTGNLSDEVSPDAEHKEPGTALEKLFGLDPENLRDEVATRKEIERLDALLAMHVKLDVTDSGWDVFVPSSANHMDYRYGPAILRNEDGSIDAWFSAPGDGYREFDYITYKHSEDGGQTWTDEQVVLTPTPNSPDALSVCDPAVFVYDGYYYIGYSSTINRKERGLCNSTFIARSKDPAGPFEKWDGKDWGGSPVPLIYFDGVDIGWGSGEPSFVVMEDTLYIYSTKDSYSPTPERIRLTEVRTADLTRPDWPANLAYHGNAIDRTDTVVSEETGENAGENADGKTTEEPYAYHDADSWDVAYLEEGKRFIAVNANRRFLSDSCLVYYESPDGIRFQRVSELNTNVIARCHNCGLMKDGSGHIKKGDPMLIGYAYGGAYLKAWGVWATRFAPLSVSLTEEVDRSEEEAQNLKEALVFRSGVGNASPIMLKTDRLTYKERLSDGPFSVAQYLRDGYHGGHVVSSKEISLKDYDEKIMTVDEENRIVPKAFGFTPLTVSYEGISRSVAVVICPDDCKASDLTGFYPMTGEYQIPLHQPFILKTRPMAVFSDFRIHELTGPEMLNIGLTFQTEDPQICDIWQDGTLIPVSEGETEITVNTKIGLNYKVKVNVLQQYN